MPDRRHQLSLLDSFDYSLQRSRRKTLSIIVREGQVEVKAPLRAPEAWIQAFVDEKRPWIEQQLRQQSQKLSERLRICQDGQFSLLGQQLHFDLIHSSRQQALLQGDRLCLFCRDSNPARLDKLFQAWLKSEAEAYMTPRTREYAAHLGVAERLQEVKYRKTRSKWGHCDQRGVIQYNWLVMMAPRAVVDYLVAHEASHLKHMDHSASFWHTVGSLCPDYLKLRHWLRDNGHRFWNAS